MKPHRTVKVITVQWDKYIFRKAQGIQPLLLCSHDNDCNDAAGVGNGPA